ncbi:hypothetical protein NDU88_004558 [Pleurodeles waltl]|uniref:Uncharacterized protein n=1 Tax=Pleurodeles waltl TaxID=8319 RepID=A0AAV7N3C5_PLEWA|nr:hypothetical protein NDU88_004558 [Pleurodeles waltl]
MSAPPLFIRSSPAVRRLRLLELPSFGPCRPASTFTRVLGRPQVRRGFWLQVPPNQAALPHVAPLSLAADQNFSGAGSVPHAQGQARSLRSVCYDLNRQASLPPLDQARVAILRSVRSPGGRGRQRSTRLICRRLLCSVVRVLPFGVYVYSSSR